MIEAVAAEIAASDAAPDAPVFVNPYSSIDPDDYLAAPVDGMPSRGKRGKRTEAIAALAS